MNSIIDSFNSIAGQFILYSKDDINMEQYESRAVCQGIAIGKIKILSKKEAKVDKGKIVENAVENEILKFEAARKTAMQQLNDLYVKALHSAGENEAQIFNVHRLMLEDEDYTASVYDKIKNERVNAAYAAEAAGEMFSLLFTSMKDTYMQARAADVLDISGRLVSILTGTQSNEPLLEEPVIILAEDITPSETIQMDKDKILAFVTHKGSQNSHAAILARTMSIPAMFGIEAQKIWDGRMAIADGYAGKFIVDPTEEVLTEAYRRQREEKSRREDLFAFKDKEAVTKSGKKIKLYANVGSVADVDHALQSGAMGIGLFRSEFLYLNHSTYPSEEEQFCAYKAAAEKMQGRQVIIRTLDIGADKQADYFELEKEDNPAMGLRAIRICFERPVIFETQLRALLRAGCYGNISIMFPMITSVEEVHKCKEMLAKAEKDLQNSNIPCQKGEIGVMIETPAAALISEELAREVDFFSIGTNDLTQYTLAMDRQNPRLDSLYDSHHPAILKLIQLTIENAHKHNCYVGICGELGADTTLTDTFIQYGVDELSVSPAMLLKVKEAIIEADI